MEWKERSPAWKVSIQQLLNGVFVHEDQETYFLLSTGEKMGRGNVLAVIAGKEMQGFITTLLLDDGTGQLPLRLFEESKKAETLQPGEVILVIGRVREFAKEKYLSPDILRKVDPRWLKVRKEELKLLGMLPPAKG